MRTMLTVLLGVILFSCGPQQPDINYVISPAVIDGKDQLQITMTFAPEPDGETFITHLNDAWGETSLYDCLANLEVLSEHSEMRINADSNRIEVVHPESLKQLSLRYSIQSDYDGPLESARTYRPVVRSDYFHGFSHLLFMIPAELEEQEEPASIALNWEGFDPEFVIHNSFGSQQRQQLLSVSPVDFSKGIFVGGDFRVHPIEVEGNQVYLAIRGQWQAFEDQQVVDMLGRTIQTQRDFWKDHSQEYFTVTLIPTQLDRGSSMGGTGLTNSFAANASNNEYLDFTGLSWLFNHELMHNWIGFTIQNANEEEQYWFSEGFTEYNNFKNISSNEIGGFTRADYFNELNKSISSLWTSPVKDAPNSEINYENFWSDRSYEKLPYYRGAIFAFYLDHLIAQDSDGEKSLDDMLLKILEETRLTGQKIDHDYFLEVANLYLKEDLTPFFQKHMVDGVPFDLPAMFERFDLAYSIEGSKVFESGFTRDEDQLVHNVVPGSQAFLAGLREGDRLRSMDMYSDPNTEAHLSYERDGEITEISFYPYRSEPVPQLLTTDENIAMIRPVSK